MNEESCGVPAQIHRMKLLSISFFRPNREHLRILNFMHIDTWLDLEHKLV
jgi:hypothetical protein